MIDFYVPPPALVRLCKRYGIDHITRGDGRGPNGDRIEGPHGRVYLADPWICMRINRPAAESVTRYRTAVDSGMRCSKFDTVTLYWHAQREAYLTSVALELIGLHPMTYEEWQRRGRP